ncbi:MAG: hypothetical protein LUG89_01285 [Methanosphaera sp.]|nr:hypothetical protein [Methanosphaera sp.]
MIKNRRLLYEKRTLKVNQENNIDSIIEFFQYFGRRYNVIATKLDKTIQYETDTQKITQTYKTTILEENSKTIIDKLQGKGRISIIIIDNMHKCSEHESMKIANTIDEINSIKNFNTHTIDQKDTFKTLDMIIKEET